tara:strand:- start:972 stop:1679 length:708 start_codon:yes stop_codon:yes gene_type:complete
MNKPRVLVGCPTSDHKSYCLKEYSEMLKSLSYSNFDVLLIDNSKTGDYYKRIKDLRIPVEKIDYVEPARERIVRARNLIVEKVLEGDYDYFLSLEQDVIPPSDAIQRLLLHNKDIVSALYFKKCDIKVGDSFRKEVLPLVYVEHDKSKDLVRQPRFKEVSGNDLMEISSCGVGCLLIHRKVFEKGVRFRYDKDKPPFDDIWFCKDARKEGFDIFLDCSIKCKHLTEGMDWDSIEK